MNLLSTRVTERPAQPYVAIPIEVTAGERERADALFPELFGWLAARGVRAAGTPFFRYWVTGGPDERLGLEAGVPVAEAVEGDRRVFADVIPEGRYATLVHEGRGETLGAAHRVVREWVVSEGLALDVVPAEGYEVWGGLYEFHLSDASVEPDPSRWRTEVACRLRDDGSVREEDGPGAGAPGDRNGASGGPGRPGRADPDPGSAEERRSS